MVSYHVLFVSLLSTTVASKNVTEGMQLQLNFRMKDLKIFDSATWTFRFRFRLTFSFILICAKGDRLVPNLDTKSESGRRQLARPLQHGKGRKKTPRIGRLETYKDRSVQKCQHIKIYTFHF